MQIASVTSNQEMPTFHDHLRTKQIPIDSLTTQRVARLAAEPLADGLRSLQLRSGQIDEALIGPVEPKAAAALAVINENYRAAMLEAPLQLEQMFDSGISKSQRDRLAECAIRNGGRQYIKKQAELTIYLDAMASGWPATAADEKGATVDGAAQQQLAITKDEFAAHLVAWTNAAPVFVEQALDWLVADIAATIGAKDSADQGFEQTLSGWVNDDLAPELHRLCSLSYLLGPPSTTRLSVHSPALCRDMRIEGHGPWSYPKFSYKDEGRALPKLLNWQQQAQALVFVATQQISSWTCLKVAAQSACSYQDAAATKKQQAQAQASMEDVRNRSQHLSFLLTLEHHRLGETAQLFYAADRQRCISSDAA